MVSKKNKKDTESNFAQPIFHGLGWNGHALFFKSEKQYCTIKHLFKEQ